MCQMLLGLLNVQKISLKKNFGHLSSFYFAIFISSIILV